MAQECRELALPNLDVRYYHRQRQA